jgi:hypothetical protein
MSHEKTIKSEKREKILSHIKRLSFKSHKRKKVYSKPRE